MLVIAPGIKLAVALLTPRAEIKRQIPFGQSDTAALPGNGGRLAVFIGLLNEKIEPASAGLKADSMLIVWKPCANT